jgi:hypothetical protein
MSWQDAKGATRILCAYRLDLGDIEQELSWG